MEKPAPFDGHSLLTPFARLLMRIKSTKGTKQTNPPMRYSNTLRTVTSSTGQPMRTSAIASKTPQSRSRGLRKTADSNKRHTRRSADSNKRHAVLCGFKQTVCAVLGSCRNCPGAKQLGRTLIHTDDSNKALAGDTLYSQRIEPRAHTRLTSTPPKALLPAHRATGGLHFAAKRPVRCELPPFLVSRKREAVQLRTGRCR